MYNNWLTKRLYIKDIISQIATPKSSYTDIFASLKNYNLGVYNISNDELETYKNYIANLVYEIQVKAQFSAIEQFSIPEQEAKIYNLNRNNKTLNNILNITELHVDGCCQPQLGAKGYARVTDQKGSSLLYLFDLKDYKSTKIKTPLGELDAVEVYSNDTPNQQINYAEITGLHLGLRIALSLEIKKINIDSITSNAWSSGRISKTIKEPEKLRICKETVNLRTEFEKAGGIVCKIDGGKNLADFGLHKN